jgi:hypothetical protein
MNIMSAAIISVAVSCALFSASRPAFAAGSGHTDPADAALSSLAGTAVPTTQLRAMRGGALFVSSGNVGTDTGNSANNSPTGKIIDNQSINNNTGITTIFQNTGNNSLMQSSTTVNISVY